MKQLITLALAGALAFTQTAKADGKVTADHNAAGSKRSEITLVWHQAKAEAFMNEKGLNADWMDAGKVSVLFYALGR
jgi:hypothetical protein